MSYHVNLRNRALQQLGTQYCPPGQYNEQSSAVLGQSTAYKCSPVSPGCWYGGGYSTSKCPHQVIGGCYGSTQGGDTTACPTPCPVGETSLPGATSCSALTSISISDSPTMSPTPLPSLNPTSSSKSNAVAPSYCPPITDIFGNTTQKECSGCSLCPDLSICPVCFQASIEPTNIPTFQPTINTAPPTLLIKSSALGQSFPTISKLDNTIIISISVVLGVFFIAGICFYLYRYIHSDEEEIKQKELEYGEYRDYADWSSWESMITKKTKTKADASVASNDQPRYSRSDPRRYQMHLHKSLSSSSSSKKNYDRESLDLITQNPNWIYSGKNPLKSPSFQMPLDASKKKKKLSDEYDLTKEKNKHRKGVNKKKVTSRSGYTQNSNEDVLKALEMSNSK